MISERIEYKTLGGATASYDHNNLGRALTRAALDGWRPAFNMIDRRHYSGYDILLTRTVKVTEDNIAEFIERDYRDTCRNFDEDDDNYKELIATFARRYDLDVDVVADFIQATRETIRAEKEARRLREEEQERQRFGGGEAV